MKEVVRAVPTLGPEPRIRAMGVVDMALWGGKWLGRMSGWFQVEVL